MKQNFKLSRYNGFKSYLSIMRSAQKVWLFHKSVEKRNLNISFKIIGSR